MSFSDKQIELIQNLYNDASLGLTTGTKLYNYLKSNGETGYTLSKINEFLKHHIFLHFQILVLKIL